MHLEIYEFGPHIIDRNTEKVTKIITALEIKVPPRDLRSKDTRHTLGVIFSQWLSLATCTFQTVVEILPSPSTAQRTRLPRMIYPDLQEVTVAPKTKLEDDLWECQGGGEANIVAYISKMFAVPRDRLPKDKGERTPKPPRRRADLKQEVLVAEGLTLDDPPSLPARDHESKQESEEDENKEGEALLGFARLYSGTLKMGQIVYCLLPKFSSNSIIPPSHSRNKPFVACVRIEALYEMMGRDLVRIDEARAGNVLAIEGLAGTVYRNATLCRPPPDSLGGGDELVRLENLDSQRDCMVNLADVDRLVS